MVTFEICYMVEFNNKAMLLKATTQFKYTFLKKLTNIAHKKC